MRLFLKISVVTISLMWVGSAAAVEPCADIDTIRSTVAKGDWRSALASTERCIKWNRESAPPPPVPIGWDTIVVGDVYFWEINRALLNAKLGNMNAAQQGVVEAGAWQQRYDLRPRFLESADYDGMGHIARGYIAERRGDSAGAKAEYDQAVSNGTDDTKPLAHSRLAVLALGSGSDSVASDEAAQGGEEPTALYVQGALAEHAGTLSAAIQLYELSLKRIGQTTENNRSLTDTLRCIDQDLVAQALERVRLSR
jgi:hypothetical protein